MGRGSVFLALWAGQLVSLIGSGVTTFALGVWVYQRSGSVTHLSLLSLFGVLPTILLLPVAGALVDRWDRRAALLLSDLGAGLMSLSIALLLVTGCLTLIPIYAAVAGASISAAFRWPAFSAAVSQLVPREQLGRAGGMVQMAEAASLLLSPILAGALIGRIGLEGILLIDVASFLVACATIAAIRLPRPRASADAPREGALLPDLSFGWTYLRARPGLLGLLLLFAGTNFMGGMVIVLATPMILSFASPGELGTALTIGGSGMLFGTLVMSLWGGPRRRVEGVLGAEILSGAAIALCGLVRSIPGIAAGAFLLFFLNAIVNASSQALWQSKVALDVQGRVFAVRRMVALSSQPLAFLVAGPLADRVFEPLLAEGGALRATAGRLVGVGPGRGIALLFVVLGAGMTLVSILARSYPRLRRLEDELPDALAAAPGGG
jgi:MFS family permease